MIPSFLTVITSLLFIIFFLIVPAKAIFHLLKIGRNGDPLIDFGLSLSLGLIFITFVMFAVSSLGIGYWIIWLLPLISLIIHRPLVRCRIPVQSLYILLIITIGVVAQSLALFRGGWQTSQGYIFPSLHDNMWNIAIITEFSHHFPPQNPAFSGVLLKNHHYLYLFFLSLVRYTTKIHIFDLYYRFGPVLVSLIYGLSLYMVSCIFTKKYFVRGLTVILGYFSGSFAYFLPFFMGRDFDWKGSTFFADQPFDQIFNPYSVLGFALLVLSIYCLYQSFFGEKKFHFGWSLITSLCIGIIYGFKSFGGIIAVLGLCATAFISSIRYKNYYLVLIVFFSLALFIPVFFIMTNPGVVGLRWQPGWLLTEMVIGQDKLNLPYFAQVENYYKAIHNYLGYIKIKMIEFLIYFVGNLGVRLLGFFYLLWIFWKKKSHSGLKIVHLYIFCCILISFSIPLLFNLGGNAYNVVQFTPYMLVLLSVYTAIFTGGIYSYFTGRRRKNTGILCAVIIILLAIPVNVKNIIGKIKLSGGIITYEEMKAITYIKDNSKSDDIILINPEQFAPDAMYMVALSERTVYLASSGYARQTGQNPQVRVQKIREFYNMSLDTDFLRDNHISYVYLKKDPYYKEKYQHLMQGVKDNLLSLSFENSEALILKPRI